ncbi:MAG TPA: FAD-dependent oxidoreductase [Steroidobacteraceae bacterium]|nr:FAD-dependent oxidoreductase [Steroidobacteraceae bacterium]
MGTVTIFRAAENGDCPHFSSSVLIVGGGHAGAQTAIALRNNAAFTGSITIVTDEAELPYERPPLSKDYLAGTKPFERLLLRSPHFWPERNINIVHDHRIAQVDSNARLAVSEQGHCFEYEILVWAAGGRARRLVCAGADLIGVHSVRSRADIDRMRSELPRVERVVIIGGGYIGLEAAAVLSKLGKSVTLVEMMARVLSRVAGPEISAFFTAEHRAHGVEIRTETAVECIEGVERRVTGVRLATGEILAAELVIVGVGIIPNIEPLLESGAAASNGVDVDEFCRTSLPNVYAIGDCAAHDNRFARGERIRLESVQNANEQAATVAKAIGGQPAPYASVPWFWSDQYDLKLQTIGLSLGYDTTVVRGDPATRSFSVAYLRAGQVLALDCVNATRDYVQGRKLVVEGAMVDPARLADASVLLKEVSTIPPET